MQKHSLRSTAAAVSFLTCLLPACTTRYSGQKPADESTIHVETDLQDSGGPTTNNAAVLITQNESIHLELAEVSAELGLSVATTRSQATKMASILETRKKKKKPSCLSNEKVCTFLTSLRSKNSGVDDDEETEEDADEAADQNATLASSGAEEVVEEEEPSAEEESSAEVAERPKSMPLLQKRFPLKPAYFDRLQRVRYKSLVKSMKRIPDERIVGWVPKLLETKSCPRNFSLVALRFSENQLPETFAKENIESLYKHGSACLKPGDAEYETTHFRQALLRHLWGDHAGALKAVRLARLSTERSMDRARVLYWAGYLEKNTKAKNEAWDQLVKEYPLSYHSLEVARHREFDPMQTIVARPPVLMSRDVDQQGKPLLYESMRWLEALYLIGRPEAAAKLSNLMLDLFDKDLNDGNVLYMSSLKSTKGVHLTAFAFVFKAIEKRPQMLNTQFMKILFPKAYLDLFSKIVADNNLNTDPLLVMSVARQESAFNPKARSTANARGLLQVLPSTARIVLGQRKPDLFNTEVNAKAGIKYLQSLLDKFGNVEQSLAGYNAGPGRIPQWTKRYVTEDIRVFADLIPFRETRNYVSSIVRNNYWYERLYGNIVVREPAANHISSHIVKDLITSHKAAAEKRSKLVLNKKTKSVRQAALSEADLKSLPARQPAEAQK